MQVYAVVLLVFAVSNIFCGPDLPILNYYIVNQPTSRTETIILRHFKSMFAFRLIFVFLIFFFAFWQNIFVQASSEKILTLKDALTQAMANNHHIKSAIATLPVAEAQLIIAKYIPNPVVGSNSEIVKGGSLHPIQIGQSLELGRKRHWRIAIAKENISKKELEIAKILWETHTQVHSVYSALSVGIDLFELAKERVDFYKSLLDVAEKRFTAGDISRLELDRAKMELLSSENDLSEFEGRLKKAKVDFNHSLGRDSNEEVVLQKSEELKPKIKMHEYKPLENIIVEALNKRLDLAILERDFGIVRAQLKKAEWERIPNLLVEGGPTRPSAGNNIWGPYVGLQFELPVFNRRQGEIKQAKAQIEYLKKEQDRIEHDINIEVTKALHDMEVREEQVGRFNEKLLGHSEDVLEMIKLGYKQGKLSLTDVLNAEQKNRDLRQKYLESLLNYQFALASLEYAVGVPLYGLTEN